MSVEKKFGADDPLSNVVEFLEKVSEDALAEQLIDVFAKYSVNIEQLNMISKLYLDIRSNVKASQYAEKVLTMCESEQQKYAARGNLAKLYNNINEPEKAFHYSNINLEISPKDPDTLLENVFSLYLMNKKGEAEKILLKLKDREFELTQNQKNVVDFNLGTYALEKGRFQDGLRGFLLGAEKLKIWFSSRRLPGKFWEGGSFPGKTLVIFCEGGGIGDEFIMIRFFDEVKKLGMNPVYYTHRKDVYEIFNRCGFKSVMDLNEIKEEYLWTYFMQLPIWLESTPESVRRTDSYLYPSDRAIRKFDFMKEGKKKRIGIRWQGNSKNERDLHRKVHLKDIMNMLSSIYKEDEVELYSLQLGDGSEATQDYPQIIDVTNKIESFDDTFAMLKNLDYVVTSCTSVLHASAIMGTKTLALIPLQAYFTWVSPASERTSIWYGDNLQLFRQVTPKKWDEPIEEMRQYILENL